MTYKFTLEILAGIAVIAFCMVFLYTSSSSEGSEFTGTDTIAASKISEISGTPEVSIKPLIPQWTPPSKEIETTLFALQAGLGGMFIGGVFGYWMGQKKT